MNRRMWLSGWLAGAILVGALTLAAAAVMAQHLTDSIDASQLRARTLERSGAALRLLVAVRDAEVAQRSYLATGDIVYMAPYGEARTHAEHEFSRLLFAYGDKSSEAAQLESLRQVFNGRLSELERVIAMRKSGDANGVAAFLNMHERRGGNDPLRAQILNLVRAEREGRNALEEKLQVDATAQRYAVFALAAFLAASVLGMAFFGDKHRQHLVAVEQELTNLQRRRSAFLSSLSNEVRNPATGMVGISELLLDSPLDTEQRHFVNSLRYSGQGLINIVDDILDFNNIENGELKLENSRFCMATTIEDQIDILSEHADRRRVRLLSYVDPRLADHYMGDGGRLAQVVFKLVNNSLKSMEGGTIVVRATPGHSATAGHDLVRLVVQDTGPGLDNDTQKAMFVPFGIAGGFAPVVTKWLVEAMGGHLSVTSAVGLGTSYIVELHFEAAGQSQERKDLPNPLAGSRALIADDNPLAAEILRCYLEAWDVDTVVASDAQDALRVAQEAAARGQPLDLAIIDRGIVERRDSSLARDLRGEAFFKDHPMVLILQSGGRGRLVKDGYKKAGFDAFLPKPLTRETLFNCVAAARMGVAPTTPALSWLEKQATNHGAGRRILVAEDNEVTQLLLTNMLERLGYDAHLVANGREAMEAVVSMNYDVVLMDCKMPEMDGLEAARRIRNNEKGRHLPIIAMTGNVIAGDAEQCLAAGMDDYLTKPLQRERLEQTLDKWLDTAAN